MNSLQQNEVLSTCVVAAVVRQCLTDVHTEFPSPPLTIACRKGVSGCAYRGHSRAPQGESGRREVSLWAHICVLCCPVLFGVMFDCNVMVWRGTAVHSCCCLSCRRVEAQRRKDRTEALLYFSVEVYRDDDFQQHNGPDLISDNPPTTTFRVLKTDSLDVFKIDLAEALVRALARSGVCEGSSCLCVWSP